jgi:NAD-dependent SIR2 family protein deacetylase
MVAFSNVAGRSDQGNTITASEYLDDEDTLRKKMKAVAELVKKSKFCVAYTGAGLSKASGIPDYATRAEDSVVKGPKLHSSLEANPTYAHCVITAMEKAGYVKSYVQQNHDGLPQKSGFPQHKINEIHGAWFDPSNPVVQFSGSLRGDLFQWMLDMEEKTDLSLVLGTSLSGMNADRMAVTPAKRAKKGKALGAVVINLQRTHLDAKCTIRVWAKLDDAFRLLAEHLGIADTVITKAVSLNLPKNDIAVVPYDANGKPNKNLRMILDLRENSKIRVPVEGAVNGDMAGYMYRKKNGHYQVVIHETHGPTVYGECWARGGSPKPFKDSFRSFLSLLLTLRLLKRKKTSRLPLKSYQSRVIHCESRRSSRRRSSSLTNSSSNKAIAYALTVISVIISTNGECD